MSYCYLPTVPRLTLTSLFSLPYSQFLSYLLSCTLEWSCQIYRFCFWLMENVLPLQYQDLNGWVGYRFEIFAWGKIRKFSPVEHNYNQTLIIIVFAVKTKSSSSNSIHGTFHQQFKGLSMEHPARGSLSTEWTDGTFEFFSYSLEYSRLRSDIKWKL